jgi:luciferase family oxidoreductase group 1
MRISILDQAPISIGTTPAQALHHMVASAQLADTLGYHRFWIAEHHNTTGLASSAPEISMAYIAAQTQRIRLGTGGTMMMHYSPYKMAEVFKTLSALAPHRIDFGAGRAPGGDGKAIYALSEGRDTTHQDLYAKLHNTLQLMQEEPGQDAIYQNIIATPQHITLPEAFLLGSTGNSAAQAGRMGLGYAYVQFFNGQIETDIFKTYQQHFEPSTYHEKPYSIACYFVTVADTDEEAQYHALPADIARMHLYQGKSFQRMSPEDALKYEFTLQERAFIAQSQNWHQRGSIAKISSYLQQEQAKHGFDELMICTIPYDYDFKLQEYTLLAQALL